MTRANQGSYGKLVAMALALAVLSGCASVNFDQAVAKTNEEASAFTSGRLA